MPYEILEPENKGYDVIEPEKSGSSASAGYEVLEPEHPDPGSKEGTEEMPSPGAGNFSPVTGQSYNETFYGSDTPKPTEKHVDSLAPVQSRNLMANAWESYRSQMDDEAKKQVAERQQRIADWIRESDEFERRIAEAREYRPQDVAPLKEAYQQEAEANNVVLAGRNEAIELPKPTGSDFETFGVPASIARPVAGTMQTVIGVPEGVLNMMKDEENWIGSAGGPMAKILAAKFLAEMAKSEPEQVSQFIHAVKNGDTEGAWRTGVGSVLTPVLVGLGARDLLGAHPAQTKPAEDPIVTQLEQAQAPETAQAVRETAPVEPVVKENFTTETNPVGETQTEEPVTGETQAAAAEPAPVTEDVPPTAEPISNAGEQATEAVSKPAEASASPAPTENVGPGIVGLGGAIPSEFENKPETATSIKNDTVDAERAKRGLPPAMAPARRSFGTVWDEAMDKLDKDPEVTDRLLDDLREKPRALTDTEDALLLQRQIDLQNAHAKATRDLAQAYEDGRTDDAQIEKERVANLSDQLLDIYEVGKKVGTETGRGLNARKMMAFEDYSLASMELQKRAANDGRPLTEEEHAEIQRLQKTIEETQKSYDEYKAKSDARIRELESFNANRESVQRVKTEDATLKRDGKKINPEQQRSNAIDRIKDSVSEGDAREGLATDLRKIEESFIRQGVTERNAVIDAVHNAVKDIIPNWERRDTMDALSGYGDFKRLNHDAVKVKQRQLHGEMQQVSKLLDMFEGQPLEKTGVERQTPTDEARRLMQQVNEAKKRFGVKTTDPATQLKSALDAIKTRLRNQIKDLQYQIDSKTEIVREKSAPPTDAEIEGLRKQRDELKERFKEVFGDKELTDEQRVDRAKSAVERSIAEYERRINEKDFSEKQSKTPDTAELKAVREKRDALKEQYEALKDADAGVQRKRELSKLSEMQGRIDELTRKINDGDVQPEAKQVNRPMPPELEQAKQKLEALNKQIAELRKKPESQREAESLQRQKEALEKRIAERQAKIDSGDTSTTGAKVNRPLHPELEQQRQKLDELNRRLSEMRNKPAEQKAAEALQRRIEQIQKDIAEKERKISTGDVSVERKTSGPSVTSPELEKLRERRDELNKELDKMRKALKPSKTPEEIALQSLKTRLRNQIGDYADRLDRGDFAKRTRTPVPLDEHAAWLKAGAERAKQAFQEGLMRDRLKNRSFPERVRDFIAHWRREFILSSPMSIVKLATAAAEGIVFNPVTEFIGASIGKVAPRFAERTEVERPSSIRIEAQSLAKTWMHVMDDASKTLRTGKSDLDVTYGGKKAIPEEMRAFMGQIHAAIKTPLKRSAFERTFAKLTEQYAAKGLDVHDPMVQARIGTLAYKEANRMLFMEDNKVVDMLKRAQSVLDQPSKITGKPTTSGVIGGTALRVAIPVIRIPTNLVARTFQAAFGLPIGAAKLAMAYAKGIETLPPEQADLIMRQLKVGSIGGAVALLGFFNPDTFGGYYQHGQKRGKKDVPVGALRVGGHDIPAWAQHHPLLQVAQFGATLRRVSDSYLHVKDTKHQGLPAGFLAATLGLVEETPLVNEMGRMDKLRNPYTRSQFVGDYIASLITPQILTFVARLGDKDKNGNVIQRKPSSLVDSIKLGVPGFRKSVPKK